MSKADKICKTLTGLNVENYNKKLEELEKKEKQDFINAVSKKIENSELFKQLNQEAIKIAKEYNMTDEECQEVRKLIILKVLSS